MQSNLSVYQDRFEVSNGEPKISDEYLAQVLGFKHLRSIKPIIERNLKRLEAFGPVEKTVTTKSRGVFGGNQIVRGYRLTYMQAMIVVSRSQTPQSDELIVGAINLGLEQYAASRQLFTSAPLQLPPPASPTLPPALLRSLAQERLRARPEWRKIRRYAQRGFQTGEIAKVMGVSSGKVGAALSQMRQLGLVSSIGSGRPAANAVEAKAHG